MTVHVAGQNSTGFIDARCGQTVPPTTCVISLRLPSVVHAALQRSSAHAGMSVSGGLDCLLRNSFSNFQLVWRLTDCPDALDAKLDVRIAATTFKQLRSVIERLSIPASVYIRKLLYHAFITKNLKFVRSNGHYTLAGRHD